ncbi:MAG: hypothetical protein RIC55_14645 [Pirellulaceae bacterium]
MDESHSNTPKKRRWWQFGIKSVLVAVLVASAFFAGKASSLRRAEEAEQRQQEAERRQQLLAERLSRAVGFELHTDHFAKSLQSRIESLERSEIPTAHNQQIELLRSMDVDVARLPMRRITSVIPNYMEAWFLSPRYILLVQENVGIEIVEAHEGQSFSEDILRNVE